MAGLRSGLLGVLGFPCPNPHTLTYAGRSPLGLGVPPSTGHQVHHPHQADGEVHPRYKGFDKDWSCIDGKRWNEATSMATESPLQELLLAQWQQQQCKSLARLPRPPHTNASECLQAGVCCSLCHPLPITTVRGRPGRKSHPKSPRPCSAPKFWKRRLSPKSFLNPDGPNFQFENLKLAARLARL